MKIQDLNVVELVDTVSVVGAGQGPTSVSVHTTATKNGATANAGATATGHTTTTVTKTTTTVINGPYFDRNSARATATAQSGRDKSHGDDRSIYVSGQWG